jgi:hypothetical protein
MAQELSRYQFCDRHLGVCAETTAAQNLVWME